MFAIQGKGWKLYILGGMKGIRPVLDRNNVENCRGWALTESLKYTTMLYCRKGRFLNLCEVGISLSFKAINSSELCIRIRRIPGRIVINK